ncbi:MAG TPA: hypothetical protein VFY38_11595 [Pseudonocardia sp.]|nr:hypothetical protein [Pseudonocardia sp.]
MHQPQSPTRPVRARTGSALRFKVVPIRPGAVPADTPAVGTREVMIDLQGSIDCLRSIKSDLEVYYWEQADPAELQSRREQVTFWIRSIADRTTALEGLVMQKGSPRLLVRGLRPDEDQTVVSAVKLLDQWIREDESFPVVASTIANILVAADRIGLGAAGATPLTPLLRPAP